MEFFCVKIDFFSLKPLKLDKVLTNLIFVLIYMIDEIMVVPFWNAAEIC